MHHHRNHETTPYWAISGYLWLHWMLLAVAVALLITGCQPYRSLQESTFKAIYPEYSQQYKTPGSPK